MIPTPAPWKLIDDAEQTSAGVIRVWGIWKCPSTKYWTCMGYLKNCNEADRNLIEFAPYFYSTLKTVLAVLENINVNPNTANAVNHAVNRVRQSLWLIERKRITGDEP